MLGSFGGSDFFPHIHEATVHVRDFLVTSLQLGTNTFGVLELVPENDLFADIERGVVCHRFNLLGHRLSSLIAGRGGTNDQENAGDKGTKRHYKGQDK